MTSPGETSAADAMLRIVDFVNPFSANSLTAAESILSAVSGEALGDRVGFPAAVSRFSVDSGFFGFDFSCVERMFNIKRVFNDGVNGSAGEFL